MEKKYVTTTNEKVSYYIHDDIAFSILSKLPLKSLKRFGCVHKSWSLLFENPLFMKMVRDYFLSNNSSCYHNASLFLHRRMQNIFVSELYSFSGERFENKAKLNLPNPFQEETETRYRLHHFNILNLGGINDFICVNCYLQDDNYKIDLRVALWNPTTDEFKVIPHSSAKFQPFAANVTGDVINFHSFGHVHGFGYDPVTYDYKMISYVLSTPPQLFPDSGYVPLGDTSLEPFWEIYSLRSNSWRKLDVVMPATYGVTDKAKVYMNGMCHWWCIIYHVDSKNESELVSFDLSNEVFFTTHISSNILDSSDKECLWTHLVVLNESIALISYHAQMTTFNISILGELSVKESWTKLFLVGPLSCVERSFGMANGKIFFTKKDEELVWFDLRTQMIEKLDIERKSSYCEIVVYKENLLPIGGINK